MLYVLIFAMGIMLVASTFRILSHTTDEPLHIGAGLDFLSTGEYDVELQHPPFGRTVLAIGPWLGGARVPENSGLLKSGRSALYDSGDYESTLALARMGGLIFYVLLLLIVAIWSRKDLGIAASLIAILILATEPTVLAHAGLATTDGPMVGLITAAFFILMLWLDKLTLARTCLLGLAAGLAIMAKYSAIPFLAIGLVVMLGCRWWLDREGGQPRKLLTLNRLVHSIVIVLLILFTAWATFAFGWTELKLGGNLVEVLLQSAEHTGNESPGVVRLPVIVTSVPIGMWQVFDHNRNGHWAFLLGEWRKHGWWYYFPVALLVKSTLPLLILFLTGLWFSLKQGRHQGNWHIPLPGLLAVAILSYCMTANINIGVRHVLLLYPLMAITAAFGAITLFHKFKDGYLVRFLLVGLLVWQGIIAVRSHPDYLPYFNFLAGEHPERVLSNSNLDWGQDLGRLGREVNIRGIGHMSLGFRGFADPEKHGIRRWPKNGKYHLDQPVSGWVAVGQNYRMRGGKADWLKEFRPVLRVGKTVDLYYLGETDLADVRIKGEAAVLFERALKTLIEDQNPQAAAILFDDVLRMEPNHPAARRHRDGILAKTAFPQ